MKWENAWNGLGMILLISVIVVGIFSVIVVGIFTGLKSINASGQDAWCFVEVYSPNGMAPQYQLYAWRDWRPNRQIGVYPTVDEAKKVADERSCPLGKPR